MEDNKIYGLLAVTTILGILVSVGAFTLLKENFVGPQGEQGMQGIQGIEGEEGIQGIEGERGTPGVDGQTGPQGEAFSYDGAWIEVNSWYWEEDNLDDWTYSFTTESDFTMIHVHYISYGSPEYAFMNVHVYEGLYATGTEVSRYTSSYDWGADSLLIIGAGTYMMEVDTNSDTDVWIYLMEYTSTGGDPNA